MQYSIGNVQLCKSRLAMKQYVDVNGMCKV